MVQYVFGTVRMPHGDIIDSEIPEKTHSCAGNPRELLRQLHHGTFHLPSPLWLICPSVVEGNTVIRKPSRETACTANKIAEYAHKAGFPRVLSTLYTEVVGIYW